MNYIEIRENIEKMATINHKDFIKAIVSFETGIDNQKVLNAIFEKYIESNNMWLLNDDFDYIIRSLGAEKFSSIYK